ncbi:T9SS type A sorting domain-containing protein, partial [Bacteroidales bacterium OttesenSCG-928-I14]|nr:T9SS type A sorting domain-containing protein [Bacteroidales bacterium OttesenSCG-928-I14]
LHSQWSYSQRPGGVGNPELWLQTEKVEEDVNPFYKWIDYSGDSLKLFILNPDYPTLKQEYKTGSVRYFNTHPALQLEKDSAHRVLRVDMKHSSLSQATIIGIFAPNNYFEDNIALYRLIGRPDHILYHDTDSIHTELGDLDYGSSEGSDLMYSPSDGLSENDFKETSLQISSLYRSLPVSTGIWGEKKESQMTFLEGNGADHLFSGYVPEVIVYNRFLTPLERQKVESYLAIKYGVSLPVSYFGSQGQLLWDGSERPDYNHRITALYRDDISGLNQTESASSYEEAPYFSYTYDYFHNSNPDKGSSSSRLLTIGYEENRIWDDQSSLFWGDNNDGIEPIHFDHLIGMKAMTRQWLVNTPEIIEDGYYVELSYADGRASGFRDHSNGSSYLMINNSASDEFRQEATRYVEVNKVDKLREKAIYKDITFDEDGSLRDVFTFAYCDSPIAGDIAIQEPDCDTAGSLHIRIIKGEQVFYHTLKDTETNEVTYSGCANSREFDIDNILPGEYQLHIAQKGGYSFENPTRAILMEVKTLNWFPSSGGSIKWVVSDLTDNYEAGFVGIGDYLPHHTIRKTGNEIAFFVSNRRVTSPRVTVSVGDELEVRLENNMVSFYLNNNRMFEPANVPIFAYKGVINMRENFLELRNMYAMSFNSSVNYDWDVPNNVIKTNSKKAEVTHTLSIADLCSQYYAPPAPNQSNEDSSIVIEDAEIVDFNCTHKNLNVTSELQFEEPDVVSFLVYNLTGQLILKEENMSVQRVQSANFNLPTRGIYIIKAITRNHGEFTKKIIVE